MKRSPRARALAVAALTALVVLRAAPAAPAEHPGQSEPPGQAPAPVSAQRPEKPHYRIPKISTPIKIDGVLDDPAWGEALKIDVNNEMDPGRNVPAPVTTLCYLAYDEDNLYAGFRANDPDPSAIRASLTDRDGAFRDDFVGLILDTFNDERRGYELFVNPIGVQMDLALNETADPEEDAAWDAIWDSAGRIDEQGYVVEMAVPFSSLRFQRSEGEQTWGIGPFRSHKRSLRHQIASTWMDPDNDCFVCQEPKVTGFAGVKPGRNLELAPTVTGQRTDSRPDLHEDLVNGDAEGDLGLTARWGITPNMTFSGALNPDFSQVEADAVQLDVSTQFALSFPEKRPFFLEAADFFQTPLSVVYTRTVADPRWGAKLTGKEGKNAFGLFVAEDERTELLLPSDQFSIATSLEDVKTTDAVLRYRRDLGASSTLGVLATHREGGDYLNSVAGLDGRWRPNASDVVTFQLLDSRTEYPDESSDGIVLPEGRLAGSALRATYSHNSRNWLWYAYWEDVDDGFRADLGFFPQVGYEYSKAGLERTWWADDRGDWYSSFKVGSALDQTHAEDGTLLQRNLETFVQLQGPWQSSYLLDQGWRDRFWNGTTYNEKFTLFSADLQPTGRLGLSLLATVGDTIDFDHDRPGDLLRLRPTVSFKLGRHLETSLDHDLQRVDVKGGKLLELNISQLRTVYQINIRTFVRAIVQHVDQEINPDLFTAGAGQVPIDDERWFGQFLFSYKLNPATVLFLGYSDNQLGGVDPRGLEIDRTRVNRTFFLKVGYALVL